MMEYDFLNTGFKILGHSGHALSTDKCVLLKNSLSLLRHRMKFHQAFFWGSIQANKGDYYIAFGYRKDAIRGRQIVYSLDCCHWTRLQKPSPQAKRLALMLPTQLSGDPQHDEPVAKEGFETDEEHEQAFLQLPQTLKEEHRLAAVVTLINDDAAVLPRGALFKRADKMVVRNKMFSGLSPLESSHLHYYVHYRKPRRRWNANLSVQPDYNYAVDFLDPIDLDQPRGCWSLHIKNGGQVVIINSSLWPGLTFYHNICTPDYGFMYVGNGRKNMDLPFML